MNAEPLLKSVAAALAEAGLEAILIGNAAAAIHGAPVTTVDFDFMFRATRTNLTKLKKFAGLMDAMVLRPYYPVSALFRVMNDDRGLQADFMSSIHGVKSFNSLRSRAERIKLGAQELWVADLPANARRDARVTRPCWRYWKRRFMKRTVRHKRTRQAALEALRKESDRALVELIRRRLALPVAKRMNFLRVRRPGGGSYL